MHQSQLLPAGTALRMFRVSLVETFSVSVIQNGVSPYVLPWRKKEKYRKLVSLHVKTELALRSCKRRLCP